MDVNLVNYIKDLNNSFNQIHSYTNKSNLTHFNFDGVQSIISSKEFYFHDKNSVKTVLWDLFKNKRDVCRHLIKELTPNRSSRTTSYYGSQQPQKTTHNPLFEANYYNHNSPDETSFSLHIKNVTIKDAFQLALYCAFGNIYTIPPHKDKVYNITSSNVGETSLEVIIKRIIDNCLLVSSLFLSIFLREQHNETSHVFNPSKIFNVFQNTEYRTKIIGDAFKLLSSTDELKFIATHIYNYFDVNRKERHIFSENEKHIQQKLEKIWGQGYIEENPKNICKDNRSKECFGIYFNTHRTIFGFKEETLQPADVGDIIIRILLYIDISCTSIYDRYKDQINPAQTSAQKPQVTFHMQQQPKTITWFNITIELKGGGREISRNISTSKGRLQLINKLRKEYNHIANNASNTSNLNNAKKIQQIKNNIAYLQQNVKELK